MAAMPSPFESVARVEVKGMRWSRAWDAVMSQKDEDVRTSFSCAASLGRQFLRAGCGLQYKSRRRDVVSWDLLHLVRRNALF
ncbi:hypothetical protein JCM24511_00184 [Saitozyma sp. JCM 24511]|nr:hypothetical protein JCM24511_00184 [Saitozyma sp. JCM 24511]